jgi:hypothetical protein
MAVVPEIDPLDHSQGVPGWKQVFSAAGDAVKGIAASRINWLVVGAGFCFYSGLFWVRNQWGDVPGTTNLGQVAEMVDNLLLMIGILVPFLTTDALARGPRTKTYAAEIAGRCLGVLAASLALAAAMLAVALLANLAFPRIEPLFPVADPLLTLSLWAHFAVPAAVLVGSVCIWLGGLLPRFTLAGKLAVCAAWVWLAVQRDPLDLSWRVIWNPTGAGLITQVLAQYQAGVQRQLQTAVGIPSIPGVLLHAQQAPLVLSQWRPFAVLGAAGLGLGLAAVAYFSRGKGS